MPSYIELDKQSSLPSSSNQGKTIIGVDTTGQLILKDNSGSVNLVSGVSTISNLSLNTASIGPKVSFTKTSLGSEVDIIIPGYLEITRSNTKGGGIYNSASEDGYDEIQSPKNTKWNSIYTDSVNYGWSNIGNSSQDIRNYDVLYIALHREYNAKILSTDLIMYFDAVSAGYSGGDKYYLVKFTKWGDGKIDLGFSYDRYELFLTTNFVRENYSASTVDVITSGSTVLKRDDNGGGLYNEILESYYNQSTYQSPLGTEWNSVYTDNVNFGFDNLNNVRMRKYDTFRNALNGNVGNNYQTPLIMHDLASDLYYKIEISVWQSGGNGGGVSYTRTLIPENQLIVFPDKTVQRTAGLPTYITNDETKFYIPEPCILLISDTINPTGQLLFPDPRDFNGQTIKIIYTKQINEQSVLITLNNPVNAYYAQITSIGNGKNYVFTSIGGYWFILQ